MLEKLGLVFSAGDYLVLGLSLFAGILAALSLALLLGAFAQDTKSAQGVITPVMILLLVPYMLSMTSDVSALSPVLKTVLYAIPFTHAFTAANNILLGRLTPVLLGDAYLGAVVLLSVFAASKIFSSEKILTMKISFGRKRPTNG